MGTLILDPATTPAVAALAQVIWNALTSTSVQTNPTGGTWPFAPDSLDFSHLGKVTISIDGLGVVAFSFATIPSPVFRGTLDLTLLEAQLTTAPNYVDTDNAGQLGPAMSVTHTSDALTKQKGGIIYLTAQANGTQADQESYTGALFRDYGTSGQVALNTFSQTPGGTGGANDLAGHIHDTDVLTDALPHTWTLVVTSTSNITIPIGDANLIAFELGGPG